MKEFLMLFFMMIILCWLIFGNLIEVSIMGNKYTIDGPLYSPEILYENTNMNWFGCWFCFILVRLLCPLNTLIIIIFSTTYYTCAFIKWLFTVGREDD